MGELPSSLDSRTRYERHRNDTGYALSLLKRMARYQELQISWKIVQIRQKAGIRSSYTAIVLRDMEPADAG
jgi:hypothetical protein